MELTVGIAPDDKAAVLPRQIEIEHDAVAFDSDVRYRTRTFVCRSAIGHVDPAASP
jgi:hypothetical protein